MQHVGRAWRSFPRADRRCGVRRLNRRTAIPSLEEKLSDKSPLGRRPGDVLREKSHRWSAELPYTAFYPPLSSALGAAGSDSASLILNGRSLVAVHDATFLLDPAFRAAIGNGLVLGFLMLRSGLVPRRFAQFGMAGGGLALLTALLVLFGAYDQLSAPSGILTLPEAAWELSLGINLIVKGFRPSPIL